MFVNEGLKVLYRVGLGILKHKQKAIIACTSKAEVLAILSDRAFEKYDEGQINDLMKVS